MPGVPGPGADPVTAAPGAICPAPCVGSGSVASGDVWVFVCCDHATPAPPISPSAKVSAAVTVEVTRLLVIVFLPMIGHSGHAQRRSGDPCLEQGAADGVPAGVVRKAATMSIASCPMERLEAEIEGWHQRQHGIHIWQVEVNALNIFRKGEIDVRPLTATIVLPSVYLQLI